METSRLIDFSMWFMYLFCIATAATMEIKDYKLQCRQIKEINIVGKRMCQKACEDLPKCQSFNYDREKLYCELNGGKANDMDAIIVDNTTYTYVEKEVCLKQINIYVQKQSLRDNRYSMSGKHDKYGKSGLNLMTSIISQRNM